MSPKLMLLFITYNIFLQIGTMVISFRMKDVEEGLGLKIYCEGRKNHQFIKTLAIIFPVTFCHLESLLLQFKLLQKDNEIKRYIIT